ncbi:ABC transporter permease [Micromonospora maris]|uniref:Transport permease protein n=1 Tax=Micromonospora maris TaxID=1003110 RepID=A0A9X0LCQ1_9ACTN|nr:ABC transporter permease [Micromonospora maris]AEB46050.1 ABC-2 type transporter [Micromonospora maris AB-18-032]KUJ45342.1 multidrug ABC transporter permease [Micromonospora maris]
MITTLRHSNYLTGRSMRILARQPAYLFFTLMQPMVWLLLFSQLFSSVSDMPGFGGGSYITFLTPGVIVMTAIMSANWAGTMFIDDMKTGVMDRSLTSPVSRSGMINGALSYWAVVTVVQALIVFGVSLLIGARFDGGVVGVLLAIVSATLLALIFAAFSCAMALVVRSQETLIGMSMFLVLPLTFLSTVLMAPALLPGWMQTVAKFNPVDWAVTAARQALGADPQWGVVFGRLGLLLLLLVVMARLATGAFRAYQRAV